ncbi:hypothetical protein Syun_024681 [Stephania yunnanensis]|uniref:Uncharacterized protein n=1 Tax=Stephania yunnanensis TaxID=152371 RepID=A0AAP0HV19_9MAGN
MIWASQSNKEVEYALLQKCGVLGLLSNIHGSGLEINNRMGPLITTSIHRGKHVARLETQDFTSVLHIRRLSPLLSPNRRIYGLTGEYSYTAYNSRINSYDSFTNQGDYLYIAYNPRMNSV